MIAFDLRSPEILANPYPLYHQLRAEDPVYQSPDGHWYLSRYDDVARVLKDHLFSRESPHGANPLTSEQREPTLLDEQMKQWMVFRDPPDHTRLRGLVNKAFTPRMIADLRPHIQEIADGLLDAVQDTGKLDMIADFAYPLPIMVISEMLGVPVEDRELFKGWSYDLARVLDVVAAPENIERGNRAIEGFIGYFNDLVAQRQKNPRDDLVTALIAAEEQGDRLSKEELLGTCIFILWAGHETTKNLIGNGLLSLLLHPDELELLKSDPGLIKSAVEEFLRYESPVQQVGRWTTKEVELGGKLIPEGKWILNLLGAANRDPDQFPDPDRLDITRTNNRQIAFGVGIHFCLGGPLARVEGQIAINTILSRLPELSLLDKTPQWQADATLRGMSKVPVAFQSM